MKIKVGQWIKDKHGDIFSVLDIYQNDYYCLVNETLAGIDFKSIIKVANTPQELIEVGDLVGYIDFIDDEYHIILVKCVEDVNMITGASTQITKILTPNSNGGYDLQWEAE
jgi:hypothetical protein